MNAPIRALLLWLLATPALAVEFVMVPGSDIGLTPMRDHVLACRELGRTAWPWGATGFNDSSGSHLYFTYHGSCGRSILFKLGDDGLYEEIPTPNADGRLTGTRRPNWVGVGWPTEDRAAIADFNNDGCIDIVQTGDETSGNSASAMTDDGVCGEWVLKETWKTQNGGRDPVADVNGDGIPDYQVIKGSDGKTIAYNYVADPENDRFKRNFTRDRFEEIDYSGEPQEIQDLLAESEFRYLYVEKFQYSDDCYALSQGGSYQGRRWTRVICDGEVVDTGLPLNGAVVAMLDLGAPYMAVQGSGEHGMYKLVGGSFIKDTAGDMPIINGDVERVPLDTGLEKGAYKDGFWVRDLDLDGDPDFVMTNHRDDVDYVMENNGGVFTLAERIYSADGVSMQVADLDGDGDDDLVSIGNGDSRCEPRDCPNAVVYYNQAIESGAVIPTPSPDPSPDPSPEPTPDPEPEPTPDPKISELVEKAEANRAAIASLESRLSAVGTDLSAAKATNSELMDAIEELQTSEPDPIPDPNEPAPEPDPEPDPEPPSDPNEPLVVGAVPLYRHDPDSARYARLAAAVKASPTSFRPDMRAFFGECETAISGSDWHVNQVDRVARNSYLNAGREFSYVFLTMAWCDVPAGLEEKWTAWGRRHLGNMPGDGNRNIGMWWRDSDTEQRWSRDNPANNYWHAFFKATTSYVLATGDPVYMDFMRNDRIPLVKSYYERNPGGGSREGTDYGKSHRDLLQAAALWRDHDRTEALPQEFIDSTLRFWVQALLPDLRSTVVLGDQAGSKSRVEGYYCDVLDNALQLAKADDAIAMGRWALHAVEDQCQESNSTYRHLFLHDWPEAPKPDMPLEYYAQDAGVLISRSSWDDDATLTAYQFGRLGEAHQCDAMGSFQVWSNGRWQTVGDHRWRRNGLCAKDARTQNVIQFAGVTSQIRGSTTELEYSLEGNRLEVHLKLSAAAGRPWLRNVYWDKGVNRMVIEDHLASSESGEFVLQKPGPDDQDAPYESMAAALTEPTEFGLRSVVTWP